MKNKDHPHILKDVDSEASAVASNQEQMAQILSYILKGSLK